MKTGIDIARDERLRQIEEEGFTPSHDDQHVNGELAIASAVYALPEEVRVEHLKMIPGQTPDLWPWEKEWYKPTPEDRIKEVRKSVALGIAEIDRLRRKKSGNRSTEPEGRSEQEIIHILSSKLQEGRDYLMSVEPSELTVEDALEAFGFGRNGLKSIWD